MPENPFLPGYYNDAELAGIGFKALGKNVQIAKNTTIIGLENISIGSNVRIDGYTTISAAGGALALGSYIHIGGFCFLSAGAGLWMDDFSGLSQGVRIYTKTDDYSGQALTNPTVPARFLNVSGGPVRIGRHVIIGSGSVVLPDLSIGEGSSVGALSLVNKSLAEWGVYFGTPARRLRDRSRAMLAMETELLASTKD